MCSPKLIGVVQTLLFVFYVITTFYHKIFGAPSRDYNALCWNKGRCPTILCYKGFIDGSDSSGITYPSYYKSHQSTTSFRRVILKTTNLVIPTRSEGSKKTPKYCNDKGNKIAPQKKITEETK